MTGTAGAETSEKYAVTAPRGGHILIVDDNTVNSALLARALEQHGHVVATADNGETGLRLLRAQRSQHDVILLDIMMPVMDGFETLRQLKADDALSDIPVIMISSVDETEAVIRCLRMGANDYIPKPFNVTLLRALSNRIDAHLTAKHAQRREHEYERLVEELADAIARVEPGQRAPGRLRQM
ncbi:MAG TPA: response regulator, partial [Chloroflexota bacterium]|nr:response regulator [Chloroflexota bacterium]